MLYISIVFPINSNETYERERERERKRERARARELRSKTGSPSLNTRQTFSLLNTFVKPYQGEKLNYVQSLVLVQA